jgi:hypothetical protein
MLEGLYAGSIADAKKRESITSLAQVEKLALEAQRPLDALAALAPAVCFKLASAS